MDSGTSLATLGVTVLLDTVISGTIIVAFLISPPQ
jgi:hypothetical protein